MQQGEKGFTILEVILFLGITGLLLLMVFIGTGSLAARQRFSDSVDNFHSYLQSQYDEVVSGVNIRTLSNVPECSGADRQPGTLDCLLLGRVITLSSAGVDPAIVYSRYIISSPGALSEADATLPDREKLIKSVLKVTDQGTTSYDIKWGATIKKMSKSTNPVGNTRTDIERIAFIRVPDSNRVVTLFYRANPSNETQKLQKALEDDSNIIAPPTGVSPTGSLRMPSAALCIQNRSDFSLSGVQATIEFLQGAGSSTIQTNYSPEAHLCV